MHPASCAYIVGVAAVWVAVWKWSMTAVGENYLQGTWFTRLYRGWGKSERSLWENCTSKKLTLWLQSEPIASKNNHIKEPTFAWEIFILSFSFFAGRVIFQFAPGVWRGSIALKVNEGLYYMWSVFLLLWYLVLGRGKQVFCTLFNPNGFFPPSEPRLWA